MKSFTSFCQVLKETHTKENWFFFSAPRCIFCLTLFFRKNTDQAMVITQRVNSRRCLIRLTDISVLFPSFHTSPPPPPPATMCLQWITLCIRPLIYIAHSWPLCAKYDVINKTGSTLRIKTPPKEEGATPIGNMQGKFGESSHVWFLKYACSPQHRQRNAYRLAAVHYG